MWVAVAQHFVRFITKVTINKKSYESSLTNRQITRMVGLIRHNIDFC